MEWLKTLLSVSVSTLATNYNVAKMLLVSGKVWLTNIVLCVQMTFYCSYLFFKSFIDKDRVPELHSAGTDCKFLD